MGYYDDTDLPYYYFMATQFALSDHFFSPVMTNTPANRLYAMAATSRGVINKPLTQIKPRGSICVNELSPAPTRHASGSF